MVTLCKNFLATMASEAEQASRDKPGTSSAQTTVPVSAAEPFKAVSRNNGIVFGSAAHVPIHDYIRAFADTIPAHCIVSASRISNQRIAMYLNSKEAVLSAVNNGLTFRGAFIQVLPLVLPTTRLTLSNVYTEIPNSVLVKQVSAFCKVVSQIRPIPIGFKDKQLAHIMSFRRQVQVLLTPNVTLPDFVNFIHAGTNYRVFLSTEAARCFECGEAGHIGKNCKKTARPNESANSTLTSTQAKGKSDPRHPPKVSKPLRSEPETLNLRASPVHTEKPSGSSPRPASSRSMVDETAEGALARRPTTPVAIVSRSNNNSPPSSYPTGSSQDKVPPLVTPTIPLTQTLCDPIWGAPPAPSRLFADVVKRKQPPEPSLVDSPKLTPIVSATPPRKLMRKVSSPVTSEPPSPVSVSLPASPIPPSPASTVDTADTDDVAVWDDTQTDDESFDWASSFPSSQGPLSSKEICKFLKIVKARKKPLEVARKFTSNISGLVRQLRPLRNSPLFTKSTQQRIYKLIKNLDI